VKYSYSYSKAILRISQTIGLVIYNCEFFDMLPKKFARSAMGGAHRKLAEGKAIS